MQLIRKIAAFLKRICLEFHNYKLGMLSALVNGGMVYYINREYGFVAAFLAALKGGLGSFFTGGFFGRITERFSEIEKSYIAYPLGMVVPTLISYVFIGILHYTTFTPEAFLSTIVPMLVSMFVNNPITIFVLRRGLFRVNKSKPSIKERRLMARQQKREEPEHAHELAGIGDNN